MAINWTKEQKAVIESRNRNLLVSAAAGSGKTAVLVERIIRMIPSIPPKRYRKVLFSGIALRVISFPGKGSYNQAINHRPSKRAVGHND